MSVRILDTWSEWLLIASAVWRVISPACSVTTLVLLIAVLGICIGPPGFAPQLPATTLPSLEQ